MPIRPENLARYPPNWPAISKHIRTVRAEDRCECAGECGENHLYIGTWMGKPSQRCKARNRHPHPVTGSIVVLTVAHLDHTPENCDSDNLKAMCQRCHNRYDAPMRRQGTKDRETKRVGQRDLFDAG